jgi:hypothetical protein
MNNSTIPTAPPTEPTEDGTVDAFLLEIGLQHADVTALRTEFVRAGFGFGDDGSPFAAREDASELVRRRRAA